MAGKILIVDEVATNRIVYKVKLGTAYYEPLLASTGAACLRIAKAERPDLILLDLGLPDIPGVEVLKQLRADPVTKAIPVVVISSGCTAEDRIAALTAGADDLLAKSMDTEPMLARLRNLLRGREEIASLASGDTPLQALGFSEAPERFAPARVIALVTLRPETALHLRHDLSPHLSHRVLTLSREEALAEPTSAPVPDVFVIEADPNDATGSLRLMSELRSKSQTRHAGICILRSRASATDTAMAYDLGADDIVPADVPPRELALRLQRLLARKADADRLRASVRDGLRLAVIDPLTGLYNRRYGLRQLGSIAQATACTGCTFAVLVIDLDHFKSVNDRFGHPAGDAVLTEVANRLTANIRIGDLLARIGGEEFLVALPTTTLAAAQDIAQRLCDAIAEKPFAIPGNRRLCLTASIGLAVGDCRDPASKSAEPEIFNRADQALLAAKLAGRNRVMLSGQEAPPRKRIVAVR